MKPKLIVIFGPQAVGKMTVGHELEKITDLKLFHNHMTIDIVLPFFDYGSPVSIKLVKKLREDVLKAVAKSEIPGIIFTFIWDFNSPKDTNYVKKITEIFESKGANVYLVELEANLDERLRRNITPHRLEHKPSKRNIEKSEKDLRESMTKFRMNSNSGEITYKNYLKINNSNLEAEKTAQIIKEKFDL